MVVVLAYGVMAWDDDVDMLFCSCDNGVSCTVSGNSSSIQRLPVIIVPVGCGRAVDVQYSIGMEDLRDTANKYHVCKPIYDNYISVVDFEFDDSLPQVTDLLNAGSRQCSVLMATGAFSRECTHMREVQFAIMWGTANDMIDSISLPTNLHYSFTYTTHYSRVLLGGAVGFAVMMVFLTIVFVIRYCYFHKKALVLFGFTLLPADALTLKVDYAKTLNSPVEIPDFVSLKKRAVARRAKHAIFYFTATSYEIILMNVIEEDLLQQTLIESLVSYVLMSLMVFTVMINMFSSRQTMLTSESYLTFLSHGMVLDLDPKPWFISRPLLTSICYVMFVSVTTFFYPTVTYSHWQSLVLASLVFIKFSYDSLEVVDPVPLTKVVFKLTSPQVIPYAATVAYARSKYNYIVQHPSMQTGKYKNLSIRSIYMSNTGMSKSVARALEDIDWHYGLDDFALWYNERRMSLSESDWSNLIDDNRFISNIGFMVVRGGRVEKAVVNNYNSRLCDKNVKTVLGHHLTPVKKEAKTDEYAALVEEQA